MAIVIMKTDSSPVAIEWVRPHAVWTGTMKQAREWCKMKNENPRNQRTVYEAKNVPNVGIDA